MNKPFEPQDITKDHILTAIEKIERENIELIPSTKYDVLINGKKYPPKEVMRHAVKKLDVKADWNKPGGEETNKFLQQFGFQILQKGFSKSIESLIEEYKHKIKANGLKNEIYKWELLGKYKGRPDVNASDFAEEIRSINYSNLIYQMAPAVIKHIAGQKPEEYRECFKRLFDESVDIGKRIVAFIESVDLIYRSLENYTGESSHHDERTVATFLTYHDPDNYAFYKSSFYKEFCRLMNEPFEKKNLKYVHYLRLLNMFIDEYLIEDEELLQLIDNAVPGGDFKDPNRKLLAQDILYTMLEKEQGGEEQIVNLYDSSIYKISMSDFKNQIDDLIRQQFVVVSSETNAMAGSSLTQGETFQMMNIGDYFYLTCGNRSGSMKLIGKITGVAEPIDIADDKDRSRGKFLKRRFETIATAISDHKYKEDSKWWTPSFNSTCIKIKDNEIEKANELIFKPYFNVKFITSDMKDKTVEENNTQSEYSLPLNLILYGPPGTGKTYELNRLKKESFTDGLKSKTKEEALRDFVARYPRWKVIAAILSVSEDPMLVNEIVEHPLAKAKANPANTSPESIGIWSDLQIYADDESTNTKERYRSSKKMFHKHEGSRWSLMEERKSEIRDIIDPALLDLAKDSSRINIDKAEELKRYNFITFHQKYSYEDFIEGIKPLIRDEESDDSIGHLQFELKKGIFYRACLEALKLAGYNSFEECCNDSSENRKNKFRQIKNDQSKHYALLIDEINRANISAVFGELITLIEDDKRIGAENEIWVELPYSGEKFCVPANLHIIGTMNTADKSIALLDIALRRRFEFETMYPEYELIPAHKEVLIALNTAIRNWRKSPDFFIGHAFFMNVSESDKIKVLNKKIIPLLIEYFQNNTETVKKILKEAGINIKDTGISENHLIIAE